MLLYIYTLLVCYVPLVGMYLPVISIGAGAPKIDLTRLIALILVLAFPFIFPLRMVTAALKNLWIISISLFACYVLLSVSWSDRFYSPSIFNEIFTTQFVPVISALIGLTLFRKERSFNFVVINYVVVCLALSLIAVYQYMFPPDVVIRSLADLDTSGLRASGTVGNPNLLAMFLVMGIPPVFFLKDRKIIGTMIASVVLLTLFAGLGATMSRKGAFTAIMAPPVYFFFVKHRVKAILFLGIGGIILAVVMLSPGMFAKRMSPAQIQYELDARATMAELAIKMFDESPIIGKGFGGYYDNFLKFYRRGSTAYSAHNIYAEALSDYGIVGFSILSLCFLLPIRQAVGIIRKSQDKTVENTRSLENAALTLSVIIPFMFSAYFAGGLLYEPRIFCVLFAFIGNIYHQKM